MPKARQVPRKLLGDEVLWFEALDGGGYRVTGETVLGPLFEGCGAVSGAQDALPDLYLERIPLRLK